MVASDFQLWVVNEREQVASLSQFVHVLDVSCLSIETE